MRPPKAPATGYVLYLNEKRKQYKDVPFPEVKELQNIKCNNMRYVQDDRIMKHPIKITWYLYLPDFQFLVKKK
jgi:hypothetical protein